MPEPQPNPYAAGVVTQTTVDGEIETKRNAYLSHEASVKSIWVVFLTGSFFCGMASAGLLSAFANLNPSPTFVRTLSMLILGIVLGFLSIGLFITGIGLGRLSPWSRNSGAMLAAIGLLAFPVGTLINGYVLYLLLSSKATMVFSPEYKLIIKQTQHIKYKTSSVSWGCLGLILLVLLIGFVAAFFS